MSEGSVEHRAAKVSLVTGISTVLSIIFQLISVPVCLHFWGAEKYGAWLAIFAASTLLRTVDGGYVTFAGNRLNLLYHQDRPALRRVLAAGTIAVSVLGLLQIVVLGVVIAFDGLGWLLGDVKLASDSSASLALVVLVISWILSGSYLGLVHRLMVPAGMLYQSAWWSMGFQVLVFIAIMLAASLRLGLLGASVLVACAQVAIYIASADYMRRKLPEFFPWWHAPDWKLAMADVRGSMVFTFSGVLQQGTTNGLILVVSSGLGAAMVPAFTTIRTMANLWTNVTTTLTSPLLPDMVRFHAHNQAEKLQSLAKAHAWLLALIVNLGMLASFPFLAWLYGIWTHGQLHMDMQLLAGLFGAVLLTNASSFMMVYLAGINHARAVVTLASIRAIFSLGLTWLLLPQIGLAAAGVGVLAAEAICLLLLATYYFPQQLRSMSCHPIPSTAIGWSLASLVVTLTFVLATAVIGHVPQLPLLAAFLAAIACSSLGWRAIDPSVRHRLIALGIRLGRFGRNP